MKYQELDQLLKNVYQDLISSRQQLFKLKAQISQTLKQVKALDQMIKQKRSNFMSNPIFQSKPTFRKIQNKYSCKKCLKNFFSIDELFKHQIASHSKCSFCNEHYFDSQFQHWNYFCPQIQIQCQSCGSKIQRKQIDYHFKRCSFRKCNKCQSQIYVKSFAYHLRICQNKAGQKNSHRVYCQIAAPQYICGISDEYSKKAEQQQISILPCSLII